MGAINPFYCLCFNVVRRIGESNFSQKVVFDAGMGSQCSLVSKYSLMPFLWLCCHKNISSKDYQHMGVGVKWLMLLTIWTYGFGGCMRFQRGCMLNCNVWLWPYVHFSFAYYCIF